MAIQQGDIAALTCFLSPESLQALTTLTGSADSAIELHQDTLRVGSALMHVIATVEIALGNAVCGNLGHYFGVLIGLRKRQFPSSGASLNAKN